MKGRLLLILALNFLCLTARAKNITIRFEIGTAGMLSGVSIDNSPAALQGMSQVPCAADDNVIIKVKGGQNFRLRLEKGNSVLVSYDATAFSNGNGISKKASFFTGNEAGATINFNLQQNVGSWRCMFKLIAPTAQPQLPNPDQNAATIQGQNSNQPLVNNALDMRVRPKEYNPGTLYYDALVLQNADSLCLEKFIAILTNYFPVNERTPANTIEGLLKGNPFLIDDNDDLIINMPTVADCNAPVNRTATGLGASSAIGSVLSSVGGLNVTNFADGLAKFIVKRTKQELNMAFFSKFQTLLNDKDYADMRSVFPNTYRNLQLVGTDIYNYQTYLQTLRESFENDLRDLPNNLPSIIKNHPDFFRKHPDLGAILQSGCYISIGLRDNVHPGEILNDYPTQYLNPLHPAVKGSVQTLQLFSFALRDSATNDDAPYWISDLKIKSLVANERLFRIFLALVYQKAKNDGIRFDKNGKGNLVTILDSLAINFKRNSNNYHHAKSYFDELSKKTDRVTDLLKAYHKKESDSLTVEQYAAYYDASLDLLECAANVKLLVPDQLSSKSKLKFVYYLSDSLQDYFDVARTASQVVLDINRKSYGSAIVNVVHIYDVVKNRQLDFDLGYPEYLRKASADAEKRNKKLQALKNDLNAKNPGSEEVTKLENLIARNDKIIKEYQERKFDKDSAYRRKIENGNKAMKSIFRYGTFMATVVTAQTSDDVEKAIENFALPPGSSRIKRETHFNVSLNAYAGLFYGYEKIKGLSIDKPFNFQLDRQLNASGLTAPIGISVSLGQLKPYVFGPRTGHWSHSLFVSIIDVGAVAAFRFKDDSTKQVPNIELRDLLSPGVFWSVGIPKCPLSINTGVQVGPNLRNVNDNENTYSNALYWRYSISICVDLPVLNLYTKTGD